MIDLYEHLEKENVKSKQNFVSKVFQSSNTCADRCAEGFEKEIHRRHFKWKSIESINNLNSFLRSLSFLRC